jgi:hypothetical protein
VECGALVKRSGGEPLSGWEVGVGVPAAVASTAAEFPSCAARSWRSRGQDPAQYSTCRCFRQPPRARKRA